MGEKSLKNMKQERVAVGFVFHRNLAAGMRRNGCEVGQAKQSSLWGFGVASWSEVMARHEAVAGGVDLMSGWYGST